ncbi:hypothetical protein ACWEOE_35890 [Amycolatopsis sp. NPDC004368]
MKLPRLSITNDCPIERFLPGVRTNAVGDPADRRFRVVQVSHEVDRDERGADAGRALHAHAERGGFDQCAGVRPLRGRRRETLPGRRNGAAIAGESGIDTYTGKLTIAGE